MITNHGVDTGIINGVWNATSDFFDLPTDEKMAFTPADQATYPYGYNRMGGEILSAGKDAEVGETKQSLPDLKESFSLGPGNPRSGMPPRVFPPRPANFEQAWTQYYSTMESLAGHLLQAFAISLNLDENFFDCKYSHRRNLVHTPFFHNCLPHWHLFVHSIYR